MTPKEKAEELTGRYAIKSYQLKLGISFNFDKQCALIAVDEILQVINIESVDDEPYSAMRIININEYWQQVKNEIEKL